MNKSFLIIIICLVLVLISCKKDKIDIYEEVYDVEFIGLWNATSHPTEFPTNAHFSPMIGLSHLEGLDVVSKGISATNGLKEMAETGVTTQLEKEFDDYRSVNYALDKVIGERFNSPGSNTVQIGVERGKHQVTFFSMIAPSPDWFVAVTTSLLDPTDGNWYDEVEVLATIYDAGTDSGTTFSSSDLVTNPKDAVVELNFGPLTEGTDSVQNMAKFIFRRVK